MTARISGKILEGKTLSLETKLAMERYRIDS
jgi:hypothetical protein